MTRAIWQEVCVGLGSNLGDRMAHLRAGLAALVALPGFTVLDVSGVWETEHVGEGEQDPHLNACLRGRTRLTPAVLLSGLKAAERARGRIGEGHGQPRSLDLDLLVYGRMRQVEADPRLPHPRLPERAFVLEPLAQVAADLELPDSGETVAALCAKIRRKPGPWVRLRADLRLERAARVAQEGGRGTVALHRR